MSAKEEEREREKCEWNSGRLCFSFCGIEVEAIFRSKETSPGLQSCLGMCGTASETGLGQTVPNRVFLIPLKWKTIQLSLRGLIKDVPGHYRSLLVKDCSAEATIKQNLSAGKLVLLKRASIIQMSKSNQNGLGGSTVSISLLPWVWFLALQQIYWGNICWCHLYES